MVQIWVVLMVALLAQLLCGRRDGSLAPQILTRNQTFERRLNESVCLPCQIRRQFTDPSRKCLFYWMKQSLDQSGVAKVVMKNGEWTRYRKEVRNNGSFHCLHIRNIRSGDHAKYVCEAISPLGGSSKVIHNLLVVNRHMEPQQAVPIPSVVPPPSAVPIPPFLITQATLVRTSALVHKNFYSGTRAKLKCAVKGDPQPDITWYHNSLPLFPNHNPNYTHIRKKTFALVINRFTNRHVGNWTCVAVNAAGNTNMTFVVSVRVGIPDEHDEPSVIPRKVSEGDNVTLRCKKPARRVHMLTWNVPKKIQEAKAKKAKKHRHRGRDPSRFSKPPRRRAPGVLHLRNVSAKTHAGEYKCVVVYKGRGRKRPFVIKIVKLIFPKDGDVLPEPTPISSEILLVKIAVPVMGSVLTLFVVIICFRCRRKTSLNNGTKTKVIEDDDDALSVQILPNIPMGTLRYHDNKLSSSKSQAPCYHGNHVPTHASLLLAELKSNSCPKDDERDAPARDDVPVIAMNPNVNTNNNNNNENESMINTINNNNDVNTSKNVISSLCEPNQLTTSVDENDLQNDEIPSDDLETDSLNCNLQNDDLQNEKDSEHCSAFPRCECSARPGDDAPLHPRCNAAEECDNTELCCKCADCDRNPRKSSETLWTSNDSPGRCRLYTEHCEGCESSRRRYNDHTTTTFVGPDLHTDDLLVQREIKNWEPLIRESKSSYGVAGACRRTKSGGDRCENDDRTSNSDSCDRSKCRLLRSRSYCEQKKSTLQNHPTTLSPQHSNNNNSVLRSHSDCSRRIIT